MKHDIAPTLLNKPEYFTCERFHCRLRVDICQGRQKANALALRKEPFDYLPYPTCNECIQGKNIQLEKKAALDEPRKPKRGKGQRNETCEFYNICLDLAAKKDWKTWNCKSCEYYVGNMTVTEKIENKRLCSKCKDNFTISPTNDLCASCMARLSNEVRKARKAKLKAPAKSNTKGKGKAEKSSLVPIPSSEIQIDFGKHTLVLDEIKDLAEEEMRPIEWQIIYMQKNHLKGIKEGTLQTK